MEVIESRCGIECSKCEFQESVGCKGCTKIKTPFHGECEVKKCVESKELKFCGECDEFPCALLKSYSYDAEHGDRGKRIEKCQEWCKACQKESVNV